MTTPALDSGGPPVVEGAPAEEELPGAEAQTPTTGGLTVWIARLAALAAAPAARPVAAVAMVALGGALLAANLGLLAPEAARLLNWWWPLALMAAGVLLIALGAERRAASSYAFVVEQQAVESADLLAASGTADLCLEAAGPATGGPAVLAEGEWPWADGPAVERTAHDASLRLERGWSPAAWRGLSEQAPAWHLQLARDVAWRLNLRTATGAAELDLAELAVAALKLRSTWGDARLTLPATVSSELDLGLTFGDLALQVPAGVEVKVRLKRGLLADLARDERRFIQLAPNEWGTPLYAAAARRCTVTVWLGVGSLSLE
jgi:hypothetical protein